MKKGQLTLILIIGLLLIIIVTFVFVRVSQNKKEIIQTSSTDLSFELNKENFQDYFDQCSRDSIISANEEYGIRESNKDKYENLISVKVEYCIAPLLNEFKEIDYNIYEGSVHTIVDFNEDTISVNVDYPISVKKGEVEFDFDSYKITFPRENYISIISMDNQEVLLPSTDKRAQIIVPAETLITDNNGNPVTSLSIKLIDKNFDNLENNVVVGNLIYEVSPSGAKFSKPMELSIDFRNKDIPQTVNENSLSIAWWDSSVGIWRGLSTEIKNGRAIAKVNHLTKFAIVSGCNQESSKTSGIEFAYQQMYNAEKVWKVEDNKIIPVNGDDDAILTNQLFPNVEFGPLDNINYKYCDGLVDTVCCCSGWDTTENGNKENMTGCNRKIPSTCNDAIANSKNKLDDSEPASNCFENNEVKELKGYDDMECLGGQVLSVGGPVLTILFEGKGNSCYHDMEIVPIGYLNGTECEVAYSEEVYTDSLTGLPALSVYEINVARKEMDSSEDYFTTTVCDLLFIVNETGSLDVNGLFEFGENCENEGDLKIIENTKSVCAECRQIGNNMVFVENEEIPLTECCGSSNLGFAYCPGIIDTLGMICTGNGFEEWNDARCDYCCVTKCEPGELCRFRSPECDNVDCVR